MPTVELINTIVQIVPKLSMVGMLIFTIVGGYFGVWVWGPDHKRLEKDRDFWREMALQLGGMSEAVIRSKLPDHR